MRKWLEEKIFCNNKKTLQFIGLTCFSVLVIYQIVLFCYGTYFNSNSDDVVQYSPILIQYINYFKDGKLSWYNFTNNLGSSIWADAYYVPLDVFTLMIFLFSFVMDATIAFSIVNLSKVFFGVIIFTYFLQKKNFKNWTVALLSLIYFAFGGCWVFATYPTYFSLFFYLPLSLVIIDYYIEGKKWLLSLYSCLLVFYNFYNAYTLFIFMMFVYIVVVIRDSYTNLKDLVKKIVCFGAQLVLGVLMALVVLLPSCLYILNNSIRNVSNFEILFAPDVYFKMINNLFFYSSGVWGFNLNGDYVHQQFNIYVGILGLVIFSLMFFMKDRTSKIYRNSLLIVLIFMLIPIFSMAFSGVAVAYTRWFNFINIILIYMIGHVLNNFDFRQLDKKKEIRITVSIIGLYLISIIFNIIIIFIYKNGDYIKFVNYIQLLLITIVIGVFTLLYIIFYFAKKKDLLYSVFAIEMLVAIIINFSVSFFDKKIDNVGKVRETNEVLNSLENINYLERVYVANDISEIYNYDRFSSVLTNGNSFHSFFNKYVYDYKKLYSNYSNISLAVENMNRFNPHNSRMMDYKYFVVSKEMYDYKLDYLNIYYENEDYVVYENLNYEPFYVYENYFSRDSLKDLSIIEKNDFLSFERNLFNGVVLDGSEYNLNKVEYSIEDTMMNRVDLLNDTSYVKVDENTYEVYINEYLEKGYEGKVIFKSESENIDSIYIDNKESLLKCSVGGGTYICEFDENLEKFVIKASGDIGIIKNSVMIELNEDQYYYVLFEAKQVGKKYLNYFFKGRIILKNDDEERFCLNGLCQIYDFDYDHILIDANIYSVMKSDEIYFDYYYDLDYYIDNNEDKLSSNKNISYNDSTLRVKYTRDSESLYDQVIVLPVAYSEEWVVNNSDDYKVICANGSYLGVLVKHGIKDIDVSLKFEPTGVKGGIIGSVIGFGIYGVYCLYLYMKRKKDLKE